MPPEAKRFDSIADIGRVAWNRCFANELEDYDYLLAFERAHIKGFTHCYYAVMEGEVALAVVPAFFTDYDLATTADGRVKTVLLAVKRLFPKLLSLKLACLGSTATESCLIGFHPSCDDDKKHELFAQILDFFDKDAQQLRTHLLAIKDLNTTGKVSLGPLIERSGFHGVTGMPSAISTVRFASIDEYLSTLSSGTRKDMRRKLKKASDIRIEYRRQVDDMIDDIFAMYLETKGRSDLQFEELTPDYFTEVLRCCGKGSICAVYYLGDLPVGANLMLVNHQRLLDKFFCMRTDIGQEYNLYFVSWFANMQYCIDKGLPYYQSGQAGYETKLRLGSELLDNWMYFRHRNRWLDKLLKLAAPLLAFDIPEKKN